MSENKSKPNAVRSTTTAVERTQAKKGKSMYALEPASLLLTNAASPKNHHD